MNFMINKSKSLKVSIIILLCIISIILSKELNRVYASENKFSREQLQDIVVSTGLSYFYNNIYTEYDSTQMDNGKLYQYGTMNWRNFNITPEDNNRTNIFQVDCSTFVAAVYMYSIGYDFSEFRNIRAFTYRQYDENKREFIEYRTTTSEDNFKTGINLYGRGISTELYEDIGKHEANTIKGQEYINDDNKSIVVYFYEVSGSESENQKKNILDNIKNILRPGDIITYRTKRKINNTSSTYGHSMLYIGDAIDSEGGFIHANGNDYIISENGVTIGDDKFSVRYDGIYQLEKNIFTTYSNGNITDSSISFTILRPINRYFSENGKKVTQINENAIARNDLNGLRIEQYASIHHASIDLETEKLVNESNLWSISKYNTVNVDDVIVYNLYLHNNSKISYCYGNGAYNTQNICEEKGYTWKTSTANNINYNNLVITAKIPENTTYINNSCSYNCTYDAESKTVKWIIDTSNDKILRNNYYRTYRYRVKVTDGTKVTNDGMEINIYEDAITNIEEINSNQLKSKLKLNEITTKVNSPLINMNVQDLANTLVKFLTKVNKKEITFNKNATNYKDSLDSNATFSISNLGFIKNIYYNMYKIDLDYLTNENIKDAIFHTVVDKSNPNQLYFAKKTDENVSSCEKNSACYKINQMLVKGFYGGRDLHGNDNKDRSGRLRITDLQVGDIIAVYTTADGETAKELSMYMYLGTNINTKSTVIENDENSYFISFDQSGLNLYTMNSTKKSYNLFNELYSKDLFVVLRPTLIPNQYEYTINHKWMNIDGSTYTIEQETGVEDYGKEIIPIAQTKEGFTLESCTDSFTIGTDNLKNSGTCTYRRNKIGNNSEDKDNGSFFVKTFVIILIILLYIVAVYILKIKIFNKNNNKIQ